jgi:hypothetical protein
MNRIIEVALSDNTDLDAGFVANDAVIAAYPSRADRPQLPFWSLLFANVTLRLLGSDDFPAQAKRQASPTLRRQPPSARSRSASRPATRSGRLLRLTITSTWEQRAHPLHPQGVRETGKLRNTLMGQSQLVGLPCVPC